MRTVVVPVLLALAAAVAILAPGASGHQSGCHSSHACPSDHHTYVWTEPATGRLLSCAKPDSGTRTDRDTIGITWEGLPYVCEDASASAATPSPTPSATPVAVVTPPPAKAAPTPTPTPTISTPSGPVGCTSPTAVQAIRFSRTRYPHIFRHARRAIRRGWPRVMVLNRDDADRRRERLLRDVRTRRGFDRDEYPAAVGRGVGRGLQRGSNPTGWRADVALVPSGENRSHGSRLGIKLRRFCDGTRFAYAWY